MGGYIESTMFWSNLITAVAYYAITIHLLFFVNNPKVLRVFDDASNSKDSKKRQMFFLIAAIATLFASYIWLCGNTHLIKVIRFIYPTADKVIFAEEVIMIICATVSFITALVCFKLFPAIVESFQHFELDSDGKIQHAENYLIEAVELVKESILMVSDKNIVLKANEISRNVFGPKVVGSPINSFVHPDDVMMFDDTIVRVANSYSFTPATIELRIRQPQLYHGVDCTPKSQSTTRIMSGRRVISDSRVYATDDSAGKGSPGTTPSFRLRGPPAHIPAKGGGGSTEEYSWVEITMCKGKQNADHGGFDYDLKMVCRDITDRKKRALYQSLMEGTEERGRINESKLRYLSCIAHDLKTPLQSFSFSLELLSHSNLHQEQREYIQQANVAIDLMKLTISQTMDISKALTGAKLTPRRSTVYISSVLNRVKIIINGYGKSVPVSFEVAPDVCDEIITDEEWLWQMLLNLLTNACKYTDKGSIHVRLSITAEKLMADKGATEKYSGLAPLLVPELTPDMLLCEVIDTGVGIDPSKIRHIFNAFAQVQEGQVTGTGLGLFGVRMRSEGLQGSCGARHNTESVTGTGTVLWFAIPYIPDVTMVSAHETPKHTPLNRGPPRLNVSPSGLHAQSPSAPGTPVAATSRGATVSSDLAFATEEKIHRLHLTAMVVEDTASVRKLMERLLTKMGFESVVCYENGSKGLDAMMAAPVDIVFSDVMMPIMTGPEMVARFRRYEKDLHRDIPRPGDSSANTSMAMSSESAAECNMNNSIDSSHSAFAVSALTPYRASVALGTHTSTDMYAHNTTHNTTTHTHGTSHGVSPRNELNPHNLSISPHYHHTTNQHNYPHSPTAHHHADAQAQAHTHRQRQLIVAVTANGADLGVCSEHGFDEICLKPLTKTEIYHIINRYFQ